MRRANAIGRFDSATFARENWPLPSGMLFFKALGMCFYIFSFQHLHEQLDLNLSALEYMLKCYPDVKEKEEMRKIIGRYGLTGRQQV